MKPVMSKEVQDHISNEGIIAVLEIESEQNAVPTARALLEGGIKVIELALRTPASIPSISLIADNVPQMYVGAGTIIEPGQIKMIKNEISRKQTSEERIRFGVSPGLNPEIVEEALKEDFPFAPGIATPSELEKAISLGCEVVKFFPAGSMGGLNYLKSINAPYNHLDIKYIPLGGISAENLASYAQFDPILAIGGSWIASKELIKAQNWKEITTRAVQAKEIWRKHRQDYNTSSQ